MTNKEKIERDLSNDQIIKDFNLVEEINENMFIYHINFDESRVEPNGLYECTMVLEQISYIHKS